jgi:hypothetical protein
VVRNNCIGGGVRDRDNGGISSEWGFNVESNNVIGQSPKFMDRAAKDFRVQDGSPCAGIANGATGSSAARALGTDSPAATPAPTTSTPDPTTTPQRSNRPSVSLTTRRMRAGHVRLRGRVRRGRTIRSAAASAPTKAVIQIRWDGAWYPLKSVPVHRERFSTHLRIPTIMRATTLKLRVVVPKVGKSSTVRVRTR